MPKLTQHWIVKQEPASYSWDQFVRDGRTAWTGVRNFQARNNLRAMKVGDLVLYYHSVLGKELVGVAKVAVAAYPDPTATEGDWVCVDLVPVKALARRVTLEELKAKASSFPELALVRNSRLSVQPLSAADYTAIMSLAAKR